MGRRKIRRMVQREPDATFYKPQGVPMTKLESATLSFEGLEAIRLADAEGMSQAEGAEVMGVSRATFGRVLVSARATVARALTGGMAIRIEGGHYTLADDGVWACPSMETDFESTAKGENDMANINGNGVRAGGRCMGGQGRGMGQGRGAGMGRCGGGRGMGGRGAGRVSASSRQKGQQPKGDAMQTIAITSEGPTLDDRVDPRFGRAGGFVIVDTETMEVVRYVDNGASQAMAQGAGIQAAENVAEAGAAVLLTGFVGPKAFTALSAAGIRIGQDVDGLTVREAVEKYKAGDVAMAEEANASAGGNK